MEVVDVDELSLNLKTRLEQVSTEASSHSIYKVPRHLRDVNSKAYEPQMVAIGPYHHGKDKLKKMEEVKLLYMQSLLNRVTDIPIEHYFSAIARVEKKARDCYADPISYNEAELTEILVLDGCFIIEFIRDGHQIHNGRTFHSLEWDLVLWENQIPFFVLCELFNLIEGPDMHTLLMDRVLSLYCNVFTGGILYQPKRKSKEVKHILDLVHSNCYPPYNDDSAAIKVFSLTILSASELKDVNVKFEKSRGTTIFDVEFKENGGVMLMPPLVISNGTESLLRNLIAYEQILNPYHEHTHFTDYAVLLDCLINTWKDVKILSQHGIIKSTLGSDEAVADLVNRLTDNLVVYCDNFKFKYGSVFHRVNVYRNKRWNRYVGSWNRALAEFKLNYFSSPWAFISLVAASVLLLLTVAQTVFAALEYYQRS